MGTLRSAARVWLWVPVQASSLSWHRVNLRTATKQSCRGPGLEARAEGSCGGAAEDLSITHLVTRAGHKAGA